MIAKPILIAVGGTVAATATAVTLDMNTIILAVIGLLGTCVTGFLALKQSAMVSAQKQQNDVQKEIHVAVNSSKTALEGKIDDLIKANVELAKKVAELEENKRGAELAKAVASVPSNQVVAATPAGPARKSMGKSDPGRLGDAIEELTDAAEETVEAAEKTVDQAAKIPKT